MKGDTLLLLPQEKEVCIKFKLSTNNTDLMKCRYSVDCSSLYTVETYLKKGWKILFKKANNRIYILTGTSRIKNLHIVGKVKVTAITDNKMSTSEVYVRIPFICTSSLNQPCSSELNNIEAYFKPQKVYKSDDENEAYIRGTITFNFA